MNLNSKLRADMLWTGLIDQESKACNTENAEYVAMKWHVIAVACGGQDAPILVWTQERTGFASMVKFVESVGDDMHQVLSELGLLNKFSAEMLNLNKGE